MTYLQHDASIILDLHAKGLSPKEIADEVYEQVIGPLRDPALRDQDIAVMTTTIKRFLAMNKTPAEILAAKVRRLAANARQYMRRQQEAEERLKQREAEQAAADRARKAYERRLKEQVERRQQVNVRYNRWHGILPDSVAVYQNAWDRHAHAQAMRRAGLTYFEIGTRLSVSVSRARQMVIKQDRRTARGSQSPIESYLKAPTLSDDGYGGDIYDVDFGRRMLEMMESLTGHKSVPPCTWLEAEAYEVYYATRCAA